jgi:putative intracellular protease/amidase
MTDTLTIVFALYPRVTHLDFTGPHQVLCRLPGAVTHLASVDGGALTFDGITFGDLEKLADIAACDVLCVPGGFGTMSAMGDAAFMGEIRRLADGARHVTSVCTGSLILGAAGLLRGRRAACHWAWRDLLTMFGAIPDSGRVVRDGNVFTGGGVTAGIDFALTLAAEIAGNSPSNTPPPLRSTPAAPKPPRPKSSPASAPCSTPPAPRAARRSKRPPWRCDRSWRGDREFAGGSGEHETPIGAEDGARRAYPRAGLDTGGSRAPAERDAATRLGPAAWQD